MRCLLCCGNGAQVPGHLCWPSPTQHMCHKPRLGREERRRPHMAHAHHSHFGCGGIREGGGRQERFTWLLGVCCAVAGACLSLCIFARLSVCIFVCLSACASLRASLHSHVSVHIYGCMQELLPVAFRLLSLMYTHTHTCTYTHTHMHTHTHAHTHNNMHTHTHTVTRRWRGCYARKGRG